MFKFIKTITKYSVLFASVASFSVNASIVDSQLGTPALTGSDGSGTLTNGWVESGSGFGWTHHYGQLTGTIESATITIDIIDADNGYLSIYSGVDNSGIFIGNAYGNDNGNGSRGVWQGLDGNTVETTFVLPQEIYADLYDGTFQVYGDNNNLVTWGSNRALLSIKVSSLPGVTLVSSNVPSVPVPASGWLLASGLIGLIGVARRKTNE